MRTAVLILGSGLCCRFASIVQFISKWNHDNYEVVMQWLARKQFFCKASTSDEHMQMCCGSQQSVLYSAWWLHSALCIISAQQLHGNLMGKVALLQACIGSLRSLSQHSKLCFVKVVFAESRSWHCQGMKRHPTTPMYSLDEHCTGVVSSYTKCWISCVFVVKSMHEKFDTQQKWQDGVEMWSLFLFFSGRGWALTLYISTKHTRIC